MFRRVLIANRGEIALRIARACRELGCECVGVFSEADRDAPWLEHVDRAVCIGPAAASASYLNQEALLQVAEQERCQALHPGYGFLAENARFAARCEQQGLTFVGPPPHAIRCMGDKLEAKRTMAAGGLETIPGSLEPQSDAAAATREAERLGFPVLLKARAGGGGKGMRLCRSRTGFLAAWNEAALEAEKAFGDRALYLERFVEGARHVEIQVLVDAYGGALHLGERECSIQRQHQKLVEESPSPVVAPEERAELGARAARAVASAGYRGAGTVEFLRDPSGSFFFMEVNARLQVEHPVTEMLSGVDLVASQLRIAANEPLALDQAAVLLTGHAIEFRINAENPEDHFRPDPGRIRRFTPPPSRIGDVRVRWDSAVREGYAIPPHYDSMIGKLIVHGPDRAASLAGARRALDELSIEGVQTTRALHRRLLDDPDFVAGSYDVGTLERAGLTARRPASRPGEG